MKKQHFKKRPLMLLQGMLLPVSQILTCSVPVSAEGIQYEGTTEMSSVPVALDLAGPEVELTVEEVYVQAQDTVAAGDRILKLSDDSYRDALDYYDAAIIRAGNSLTDTQRSYDQGVLEVQYEYEQAKTQAGQAEFIRQYQTDEVADCIEDHEEMIASLEERIADIEAGNYGSSSSGGSSSSSGSGSRKSGGSSGLETPESNSTEEDAQGTEDGQVPETEPGGQQPGDQTSETEPGGQQPGDQTSETEPGGQQPGDQTPETEPGTSAPETEDGDPAQDEAAIREKIAEKKEEIANCKETMSRILEQLQPLLEADADSNDESDTASDQEQIAPEGQAALSGEEYKALEEKLQTSIAGDTQIKGHMNNVKDMADDKLKLVKELAEAAGIEYSEYLTLLDDCIALIESDISLQQEVKDRLSGMSSADHAEASAGDTAGSVGDGTDTVKSLAAEFIETGRNLSSLYEELTALEEEQTGIFQEENQTLRKKIEQFSQQEEDRKPGEQETENVTPGEQKPGEQETDNGAPGEQKPGEQETENVTPGEQKPGDQETENGAPGEQKPGDQETEDRNPDSQNPGDSETRPGETNGMPGNMENGGAGANASAGGNSFGGMSMSMPGSGSMPSGSGSQMSAAASSGSIPAAEGNSMSMSDLKLTESDISLFGNSYDLSQYESMLEREPSDSDAAAEYLDTLYSALRTVTAQYRELLRNRPANELKIQYYYDSLILQGKLAEITYEQEMQEWADTLREAEQKKEDLTEKRDDLVKMTDGIICAPSDGVIASVSYEAEDVLSSSSPVMYYYDTAKLTITIEVMQDQISGIRVGDAADVTIGGIFPAVGIITEKASEPQEGNSRTTVIYEVKVSVDNEDGLFSSGMAATVDLDAVSTEAEEGEHE